MKGCGNKRGGGDGMELRTRTELEQEMEEYKGIGYGKGLGCRKWRETVKKFGKKIGMRKKVKTGNEVEMRTEMHIR